MIKYLMLLALLFGCQSPEDYPVDRAKSNFTGTWIVENQLGNKFEIKVFTDGTAESTWDEGEQGRWKIKDDRLHLKWTNGWHDVIYRDNGGFVKIAYAPGTSSKETPTSRASAERIDRNTPQ